MSKNNKKILSEIEAINERVNKKDTPKYPSVNIPEYGGGIYIMKTSDDKYTCVTEYTKVLEIISFYASTSKFESVEGTAIPLSDFDPASTSKGEFIIRLHGGREVLSFQGGMQFTQMSIEMSETERIVKFKADIISKHKRLGIN